MLLDPTCVVVGTPSGVRVGLLIPTNIAPNVTLEIESKGCAQE